MIVAFRATLEEVLSADLILHVRDISHENTKDQDYVVKNILQSLGVADDIPILEVWNKINLLDHENRKSCQNIAERHEYAQSRLLQMMGFQVKKEIKNESSLKNFLRP